MSQADIDGASEFQRAILSDGKVEWAEYERAVLAQHTCLARAGYSPGPIERHGSVLSFVTDADYSQEADPAAADRAFLSAQDDCAVEYVRLVGAVWAQGLVVTDEDERERLRRGVVLCLNDSGLSLPADASLEAILAAIEGSAGLGAPDDAAAARCVDQFDRLFYVPVGAP